MVESPGFIRGRSQFDLETSGLRPDRGARITEIAVVGSRGARMNWQWADVETERPVGGDCYDRTVTPHLARLTDVLTRGVVIGHNLSFDFDFLTYEIERLRKRADPDAAALRKGGGAAGAVCGYARAGASSGGCVQV
jgi:hypothetical protein